MEILQQKKSVLASFLKGKALEARKKTIAINGIAPGTRLASSLSDVELFTALFYGGILKFDSSNIYWEERDRFVVSKGHGAISLYPILADLGFFDPSELERVSKEGALLGDIPDSHIPGFETINGSLGHGLGVACGMALGLKQKQSAAKVFVLLGNGELGEGSVWEAIMFAGHHQLNNLILIIDNNKLSMLDYSKNVIDLEPIEEKLSVFKWKSVRGDGHDVSEVHSILKNLKEDTSACPRAFIADTVKGKGVPRLESDVLCHIKSLKAEEIPEVIKNLSHE